MLRPFQTLPPGPVVLVGSDIPGDAAVATSPAPSALLGRHELVFGPASDGGFWLIGARRRRPMPQGLFAGVRWSTAHALADTRAKVPTAISAGEADTLDDIDTADDLRRLQAQAADARCLSTPSSARTAANTESQSPGCGWRNRRAEGYQGASVPPSCQRQSAVDGSSTQVFMPIAAARWAIGASIEISRSSCESARGRLGEIEDAAADIVHQPAGADAAGCPSGARRPAG